MVFEELKIENAAVVTQDLPVVRIDAEKQSFIVEWEGTEHAVPQEAVQKQAEMPETISCQITKRPNGTVKIVQNLEPLIAKYLPVGTLADFSVKSDFRLGADGTYELQDCRYGFIAYLKNAQNYHFFKGQTLRCRIEAITGRRPSIRLMDMQNTLTHNAFSVAEDRFLELMNSRAWDRQSLINLILSSAMDSDFTNDSLDWLITTLKTTSMSEYSDASDVLKDIRDCCLTLLEETDLLTRIGMQERRMLVARFTTLIELVGYVASAVKMGNKESCSAFVDNVLHKLRVSGCLYHPVKNFGIMTSIFTLMPELMEEKIEPICKLLRVRDLNYWRQDPFRREFVRLLEIYIRRTDAVVSKLAGDDPRIDRTFRALAIQLLLIDKSQDQDLVDIRLNHSMFYRYASYSNQASDLISAAFGNLCGSVQQLTFNHLKATEDQLLPFHITSLITTSDDDSDAIYTFNTGEQQLVVSDEGITVTTADSDDKHGVLATDLLPWNNLQVELKKRPKSATMAQNSPNIRPYAAMWNDIINNLFSTAAAKKKAEPEQQSKKTPMEGDEVFISVKRRRDDESFWFVIDDPEYESMEGWLDLKTDVAGYSAYLRTSAYCDDYGKPLHLLATILSISNEGICHFSIMDCLKDFDRWYEFSYDNLRTCYVGDVNPTGAFCVAEDGVPVFIKRENEDFATLKKGDLIEVTGLHDDGFRRLQADEFRPAIMTGSFDLTLAYCNLMRLYADSFMDTYEDASGTKDEQDGDVDMGIIMEPSHVRELMLLVERVGALSNDHVKTYNYMGMARVMARMLRLDEQERYYKGQMKMIEFLSEFELNDQNDREKLDKFYQDYKEFFTHYANLYEGFRQLEFLSFLGRPESNAALWAAQNSEHSDRLRKIAKLVLSYNFLTAEGLNREADEALERVKTLLNLRTRQSNLKDYGREGQTVEFKTSILFPPASGTPRPQMETILRVICSFLNNPQGGTLYVGVNDQGMGVGVENDLRDPRFYEDKDKYERYLLDNVRRYLGAHADSCCRVEWENESDRDIMAVHIAHCPYIVLFNGQCFERNNSRTHVVAPGMIEDFMQRMQVTAAPETRFDAQTGKGTTTKAADYVTAETATARDAKVTTTAADIATSHTLNRAADGTVEYPRYLQISEDGRNLMLADQWPGGGALCMGFDDADDGRFLVAVWEDGAMMRIPMSHYIEDKNNWTERPIKNHKRLHFLAIAGADDAVLFYYRSKIRRYLRVDTVLKLNEANSLSQSGQPVTETQIDDVLFCEIVPAANLHMVRSIVDYKPDNAGTDVREKSTIVYHAEEAIGRQFM